MTDLAERRAGSGTAGRYDLLRVRAHESRSEGDGGHVVLSFGPRHHVRVTALTALLISAFDGTRTAADVAAHVPAQSTGVSLSVADVEKFVDTVLRPHGLLEGSTRVDAVDSHDLLWWHLPIVDTRRLGPLLRPARHLFHPAAVGVLLALLAGGLVGCLHLLGTHGVGLGHVDGLALLVAAYWSMVVHEAGHVAAVHRVGGTAGKAGIGLYLLLLVFYVDLSDAWRLPRRQRMMVDAGGVYFQALAVLPLAGFALATDHVEPALIFVAVLAMSSVNLFPFLRLDGYWLLCDGLELSNLARNALPVVRDVLAGRRVTRTPAYVLASALYVLSTGAGMAMALWMIVGLLRHTDTLAATLRDIAADIRAGQWGPAVVGIDHVFLLLIPALLLVAGVVRGGLRQARQRRSEPLAR